VRHEARDQLHERRGEGRERIRLTVKTVTTSSAIVMIYNDRRGDLSSVSSVKKR
jgi:hypothetical protein